jgi:excisionase family DNA binding protein
MTAPIEPGLPILLTVKEVAGRLRVSPPTVYSLIKSGDLPAITFSTNGRRGSVRVTVDDLKAFYAKHYGGGR